MMINKIEIVDNIHSLLRELVLSNYINVSYGELLLSVNKYFHENYIDKIAGLLKRWGIRTTLRKVTMADIDKIAKPSFLPLFNRSTDCGGTELKLNLLICKNDDDITLFDSEKGYYHITEEILLYMWIETVIELGIAKFEVSNKNIVCDTPLSLTRDSAC